MTTILRIDASPRGAQAHSWRMADEVEAGLTARAPGTLVARRHLFAEAPALVDEPFTKVMTTHTTAEAAGGVVALATSEALIAELEAADSLLLATPMHNYTVPAPLKAWIDQIVRFGRTFRSSPEGKIGLLRDRPTYVVISSGGYHTTGGAAQQPDFLSPYLTAIFHTIGIRDVTYIRMEGLSRGEEAMARAYASARAQVAGIG